MIKKDALWGNINVDQIPNNIEIKNLSIKSNDIQVNKVQVHIFKT